MERVNTYIKRFLMTAFLMLSFSFAFDGIKDVTTAVGFAENADIKVYGATITVKKGDKKDAVKVHKKIYKAKAVNLKVKGKAKKAGITLKKLKKNIQKVNKYGVIFNAKKKKTAGGYTYYSVKKEYAKQYREAVLTLKAIWKDYINRNTEDFGEMVIHNMPGGDLYVGDEYAFEKMSSGTGIVPEIDPFSGGEAYVSYMLSLITKDGQFILGTFNYFSDRKMYEYIDSFGYAQKMAQGEYLDSLKNIYDYKIETSSDLYECFYMPEEYITKIKSEIASIAKNHEKQKKEAKANYSYLTEEAVKYIPDFWDYRVKYKRFIKAKNTGFSSLSTAMKVAIVADCFWCDYEDEEKNPFIHYSYESAGSAGGQIYHWPDNKDKNYFIDYSYEGKAIYSLFEEASEGKVSTILRKFRKGKLSGTCHDYATMEKYIYTLMGLKCYYCYGKEPNHAISVVKVKNSKGKSFWVYQNYDEILDGNDIVGISGLSIAANNYIALQASDSLNKKIGKSRFSDKDIN